MRYTPPVPPPYLALEACPAVHYPTARRRVDARLDAADLAKRGTGGTLRGKARQFGVSHEAVRQAMRATDQPTDLESRNARIRAMAEHGEPWPAIAAAFGLSPSAVRRVCRDMPRRRSGRKPRRHLPDSCPRD
jgi:hypothetical protein